MGRLAMLVYSPPSGLTLLPLGEVSSFLVGARFLTYFPSQTSPASTFTYLTSQVVYVGSYLADSLLIRLHHTSWRNHDQPTLEVPLGITVTPPEQVTHPVTQGSVVVDAKGDYVETLEEYPNLAPMEDAIIVDLAGSGQVRCILFPRDMHINVIHLVAGSHMLRGGLLREHKSRWPWCQPARDDVCTNYGCDLRFSTSTKLPREVSGILKRVLT
jgi:hypothetical protein